MLAGSSKNSALKLIYLQSKSIAKFQEHFNVHSPFSREIPNTMIGLINEGNGRYVWQWNDNYLFHSVWYFKNISSTDRKRLKKKKKKKKEINNPLNLAFPKYIDTKLYENWILFKWFLIFSKSQRVSKLDISGGTCRKHFKMERKKDYDIVYILSCMF